MRAELGKGSRSIVFVWGDISSVVLEDVKVYVYDGMRKVSVRTYNMSYGRVYWKMLTCEGYHIVPTRGPQVVIS